MKNSTLGFWLALVGAGYHWYFDDADFFFSWLIIFLLLNLISMFGDLSDMAYFKAKEMESKGNLEDIVRKAVKEVVEEMEKDA